MNVGIESDPKAANDLAAEPTAVLGLATGNTPRRLYQRLIEMHRLEGLDFSQVRTFSADGRIAANDPGSSLASPMRRVPITLNKRGYLADDSVSSAALSHGGRLSCVTSCNEVVRGRKCPGARSPCRGPVSPSRSETNLERDESAGRNKV